MMRNKSIFDEVTNNEAGPAMRYAVAVARGMMHMNDARWDRLRLGIEGDNDYYREYWDEEVRLEDVRVWKALSVVSAAEALEMEYSLR